jgi:hypothetical protein
MLSHFGGLPYMERGEVWPVNRDTKQPLDFVLQLVAGPRLALPNGARVWQLFYDFRHPAIHWRQGGWRIKTYSHLHPDRLVQPSHSRVVRFCSIELGLGLSLPDWDSVDLFLPAVSRFCQIHEPASGWNCYEKLRNRVLGSGEYRSFVGGYPQWIQGLAYPVINNYRPELFLQLDSEEAANLQWGRGGTLYMFTHPQQPDYGLVWQGI